MILIKPLIITFIFLSFLLSGCSNNKALPNDGPIMQEVYDGNYTPPLIDKENEPNNKAAVKNQDPIYPFDINKYSSEGIYELENNFIEVPNPTLYIYVRHHLTDRGLPVPGYTTKIKMYKKVHFALPGEVK